MPEESAADTRDRLEREFFGRIPCDLDVYSTVVDRLLGYVDDDELRRLIDEWKEEGLLTEQ